MKIPSKNIKLLVVGCAFIFTRLNPLAAACTLDTGPATSEFSPYSGHIAVTQIFTACESGPLQSFSFSVANHGYEAQGVSVSIAPYSPAGNVASSPSSFDLGSFDIFPKETGRQETFIFTPTNIYDLSAEETYVITMIMTVKSSRESRARSGGFEFGQTNPTNQAIGVGSIANLNPLYSGPVGSGRMMVALAFKVDVQHPLKPIPTMSTWGLLVFGLLVLNGGLYFIRKLEWL